VLTALRQARAAWDQVRKQGRTVDDVREVHRSALEVRDAVREAHRTAHDVGEAVRDVKRQPRHRGPDAKR